MVKTQSLDDLVKEQAIIFADQLRNAAEFAEKEEEIRIEAERALAVIEKKMGITLRGRHEHTIGTGRIDSVYGCVIIEYKNPHSPSDRLSSDRDSGGNQKVIKQIQKRFSDFKEEQQIPMDTMFGVGCDGKYFIFVRYREDKWFVEEPVEVSKYSAERFLWAIINMGTKGKAFAPEYLAGDFGSDSPLSHEGIKILHDAICNTSSEKAKVFFQQWKILFGEVCGFDVDTPSDKIKKLAEFYGIEGNIHTAELLFSIHSYYSIFMKLLASEIVAFFHQLPTPLQKILKAPTTEKLRDEMEDLERGSIFHHLNITNFLEGDLFAWYPDSWNESIDKLVRGMANKLDGYNPGTLSEDPANSRDLLKKLYQQLFPKSVRHDLGEYYTPDWLAEHILNELEYEGNPDKRLLDPACGSGTFLVMTINKIRKWYDEHRDTCGFDEGGLARRILKNVVGFDLNPLAVMAARTNYLIAMKDLVGRVDSVEIPIYLCDSIMTPSEYGGLDAWTKNGRIKTKELKTSVFNFKIPLEIAKNSQTIAKYADQLEFCIRNGYEHTDFITRCKSEGLSITAEDLHIILYKELLKLDKENKNGVWARIIKNAFAPLFCGNFDYIAGNPPWVNWENLPQDYRKLIAPLWQQYNLFRHKGYKAKLGGGKDDISILMTYVSHDSYLKDLGSLGFVITQSVFKSKGGGEGFRNFNYIKNSNKFYLEPIHVDDMSLFQPFEGAANRTAVFICKKSKKQFNYPIQYIVWSKTGRKSIGQDLPIGEVTKLINKQELAATPIDKENISSPWLTAPFSTLDGLRKIIGPSDYSAKAGNCTWLNGVYWIRIIRKLPNNKLLIENLSSIGKKKIKQVQTDIESDLVYPLLRGRDVKKWIASPSIFIILPNKTDKLAGIPKPEMKNKYPHTYAYFKKFENQLKNRSGFKQYFRPNDPIWSIYNVGPYTFSPYKVIWREQSTEFQSAVISSNESKQILPDHKLMQVPLNDEDEAHYLSALLNSSPSTMVIKSYVVSTQTSTHVLENISIPKYLPTNRDHIELAELSKMCHNAAFAGKTKEIESLEIKIDDLAKKIWNLNNGELKSIQNYLKKGRKNSSESKSINIKKNRNLIKNNQTKYGKLLQLSITPQDIMHLSHKAKYNDILDPKQRKALFQISRKKSHGYELSRKQIKYLEDILKEAINQGILDAKCNHHECEICKEINDKLKN